MPMLTLFTAFLSILTLGCGAFHGNAGGQVEQITSAPMVPIPSSDSGCDDLAYSRDDLRFRCGAVTYDLLQVPVRSRQVFDLVSREAYTRRHYLVRFGGRRYAFKAEQLAGERYPRRVLLETRRGFTRLLLDRQGNVVSSSQAPDLSR
jgi:hypothetical protein